MFGLDLWSRYLTHHFFSVCKRFLYIFETLKQEPTEILSSGSSQITAEESTGMAQNVPFMFS